MRTHRQSALAVTAAIGIWLLAATAASAQTDISWSSIDGGGITFATDGGSLELGGTVGQPDVGDMTDGTTSIHGGFWFDVGPPTLNVPGNITITCGDSTDPSNTGQATGSDDCDSNPVINHSDVSSGSHPTIITRTWTLTDDCGNSLSGVQTITVNDIAPPTSPIASPNTICAGASSVLSASVPGGETVDWYTASCGGTSVPGGSAPTVTPSITTTYYAQAHDPVSGCLSFTCATVTVMVNANPVAPTSASVDASSWCAGSGPANITLTAVGGSGDTLNWYSGTCSGSPIGNGSPLVITAPLVTTTYYARWETTSCGNSSCASVTVTVNANPVAPTSATVDLPSYCSNAAPPTITLTAADGSGDTLTWYSGACGGTSVGTGTPLVISAPLASTTYYARWETSSCGNSSCASVAVTVNASPVAPTAATVDSPSFCSGSPPTNITLTALGGSGDMLAWYSGSCGDTAVGTGSLLMIAAPGSTTTYFARWETASCGSSPCASVSVTVNASPSPPTTASVDASSYCSGSGPTNITLTATGGSGTTLNWHTGSCGGASVGTGTPLIIPAPGATTTYYARWETSSCGDSTCTSVTVTVNTSPAPPTSASVDSPSYCSGSAPATITLTAAGGSGDTLAWYSGSCGGTAMGTGNALVIPAPGSTTTYYARWESGACGNSTCAGVTVTVNASPTPPTSAFVDSSNYCSGSPPTNITLSAIGGSGTTLAWYSGSCGGTSVGSGSPLIISAPSVSTTYYTRWETTSCGNSPCASVAVTVNASPGVPSSALASPATICNGSSSTLSAKIQPGETIDWYTGSCGGTVVASGNSISVSPSVTTTYYARARNIASGCLSSTCATVTVSVTPNTATVDVAIEFSPTIAPLPLSRCISFELWDCTTNNPPQIFQEVLTFSYDIPSNRALAIASLCVPSSPSGSYSCITARDALHTLRSMSSLTPLGPAHYSADFTGARATEPGGGSGHRLVGGNLNDDIYIDILDFGAWAGQYLSDYGTGNTTCSTDSLNGDISGNGIVDSGDFSFIAINFLMVDENNCCTLAPFVGGGAPWGIKNALGGDGPLRSISVAQLRNLGLVRFVAGDVNNDGMLDERDIAAVFMGQMPTPQGSNVNRNGHPAGEHESAK